MDSNIINFSDFFKNNNIDVAARDSFREEFKEFIAPMPVKENTEVKEVKEDIKIEKIITENHEEVVEEEEIEEIIEDIKIEDNYYSVYRDKSEDFSCDISVEGANLNDTEVRLILESDDWTLMFVGEIDRKGKCIIPMKKLNILEEGVIGKIKLEVIADGSVFTPWEDDFKVKLSKKVTIKMNETKTHKKQEPVKPGVKVNFRK